MGIDYEAEVYDKLGLRLMDPYGSYGDDKSGCFVLVRPDGYVCSNGFSGDAQAASVTLDYAVKCFTR